MVGSSISPTMDSIVLMSFARALLSDEAVFLDFFLVAPEGASLRARFEGVTEMEGMG